MHLQFLLTACGIYATFLTWGVLQERVTTTLYENPAAPHEPPAKYSHVFVLNCIQALCACAVALVYLVVVRREALPWASLSTAGPAKGKGKQAAGPASYDWALIRGYLLVGGLNTIASPFGYASLQHIDYPTMILGKSCKLVPVMLMHLLIYRKSFPAHKYASVALITAGVSAFMLLHDAAPKGGGGGPGKARANSLWGLALLGVNLAIDGLTNSTQDHIFQRHRVSGTHMMFFMNLASFALTAGYLLSPLTAELPAAAAFIAAHPRVWTDIALFGVCGGLGQIFIFYALEQFGSMALVTITVTRKLFTILISVLYFGHDMNLGQWASVGLVFAGIALEAYCKPAKTPKSKQVIEGQVGDEQVAVVNTPKKAGKGGKAGKAGKATPASGGPAKRKPRRKD